MALVHRNMHTVKYGLHYCVYDPWFLSGGYGRLPDIAGTSTKGWLLYQSQIISHRLHKHSKAQGHRTHTLCGTGRGPTITSLQGLCHANEVPAILRWCPFCDLFINREMGECEDCRSYAGPRVNFLVAVCYTWVRQYWKDPLCR